MKHSFPIVALVDDIEQCHKFQPGSWLSELSRQARIELRERGLPKRGFEDWKYTGLRGLAETPWRSHVFPFDAKELADSHRIANALNVVVVNGRVSPDLSDPFGGLPDVSIRLINAEDARSTAIRDSLMIWETSGSDVVANLSHAGLQQLILIKVPNSVVAHQPIHILQITGGSEHQFAATKLVVDVERGGGVSLIETSVQAEMSKTLAAGSVAITVGEGAYCKYYRGTTLTDVSLSLSQVRARLKRDARFEVASFALGGKLNRHEIVVELSEPGAHADLNGLYLPRQEQHIDQYIVVDHQAPHCSSNQFFKGILDDHGRGVFSGKVFVRKNAQQTNAQQLNKNLLISPTAEVDAKPQLEIDADDVKCSHGAAIGQLNADEVFYLRSRGIPEATARRILSHAFADEVAQRLTDPLAASHFAQMISRGL
jgi:Fe-S cluster assembly protein SufD